MRFCNVQENDNSEEIEWSLIFISELIVRLYSIELEYSCTTTVWELFSENFIGLMFTPTFTENLKNRTLFKRFWTITLELRRSGEITCQVVPTGWQRDNFFLWRIIVQIYLRRLFESFAELLPDNYFKLLN